MGMQSTTDALCLKGSLTVEASLVMPIVIILILPFLFLLRMLFVQEIVEEALQNSLQKIATESYLLDRIGLIPEGALEETADVAVEQSMVDEMKEILNKFEKIFDADTWQDLIEDTMVQLAGQWLLKEELRRHLAEVDLEKLGIQDGFNGLAVGGSRFFYTEDGHHNLLQGVVYFRWTTSFEFWNMDTGELRLTLHSFTGEKSMKADDLTGEETVGDITVYSIGNGQRYHSLDCYLIQKDASAKTATQAEAVGQEPCTRCNPQGESVVYSTRGGEHYHRKTCTYLYPQLNALSLQEAVERGYTACELCQSGESYFK